MVTDEQARLADCLHDLRQPLNVIGLATANLRSALCPQLEGGQAEYLQAKLGRIEEQLARANALADQLAETARLVIANRPA